MKFLIKIIFGLLLLVPTVSFSSNYSVDLNAVDNLISSANEIDISNQTFINLDKNKIGDEQIIQKNPFVAWILTYTIVGFHRLYLGTSMATFAAYFITLGGFLVLDIIDYAVLLAAMIDHRPMDKYVNNPNFFMWN
jgi:TM2 domain-containing membrane protein YozV